MLVQPTPEVENLLKGKSNRLQLTYSLQDYFALNPKIYNKHDDNGIPKKVRFADDSESEVITHHDNSSSIRSLTSIAEETIGLDHTQHNRHHSSHLMELDITSHHRSSSFVEIL